MRPIDPKHPIAPIAYGPYILWTLYPIALYPTDPISYRPYSPYILWTLYPMDPISYTPISCSLYIL